MKFIYLLTLLAALPMGTNGRSKWKAVKAAIRDIFSTDSNTSKLINSPTKNSGSLAKPNVVDPGAKNVESSVSRLSPVADAAPGPSLSSQLTVKTKPITGEVSDSAKPIAGRREIEVWPNSEIQPGSIPSSPQIRQSTPKQLDLTEEEKAKLLRLGVPRAQIDTVEPDLLRSIIYG